MPREQEFDQRARRLARGIVKIEDLTTLLLHIRSLPKVSKSIREIGDMVSHARLKDRGLAYSRINDAYTVMAHQTLYLGFDEGSPERQEIPRNLHAILDATLRLTTDDRLMQVLGWTRQQATTHINKFKSKFDKLPDGKVKFVGTSFTKTDEKVKRHFSEVLLSRSCYNSEELIADFAEALIGSGFLEESDREGILREKDKFSAFVLYTMHGMQFELADGKTAETILAWSKGRNEEPAFLKCSARIETPFRDGTVKICFNAFSSGLNAEAWYQGYDKELDDAIVENPIEIGQDFKILVL